MPTFYRATTDTDVFIWDDSVVQQFSSLYDGLKNGDKTTQYPIATPRAIKVRAGVEFSVEFGDRRVIATQVGDIKTNVVAVGVSVTLGKDVHSGLGVVYGNFDPVVVDRTTVKIVKKRDSRQRPKPVTV